MVDGRKASALFTDLYEVTMGQVYAALGMAGEAVFEVSFRTLPPDRTYVVAAGLLDVVETIEAFRFDLDDLEYLRSLGISRPFLDWLEGFRFTGDVWSVPEGTVVFPYEPILQVVAPIAEAQLFETCVLNRLHLQSVIASKAARVVEAARGRPVVEFGSRRAHGVDAGLGAARASYLAGAAGTSNLQAAKEFGIPPFGTMAHSFVQAFDDEAQAFEAFARMNPGTTLLVDTYDTLRGIDRVVEIAGRLGPRFDIAAVRLDSGDLGELAKGTRARLDAAGLGHVKIFASSGLDEASIDALLAEGAPIDAFGVGTSLSISSDAPSLDMVYKLVEYDGEGRTKLSSSKVVYPGRKQIFRRTENGVFVEDLVAAIDEDLPGEPLLLRVMEAGERVPGVELGLEAARARARSQIEALPPHLRGLDARGPAYPVRMSDRLEAELRRLREKLSRLPG